MLCGDCNALDFGFSSNSKRPRDRSAAFCNLRPGFSHYLTRTKAKTAQGRNPQKGETRQGAKPAEGRNPQRGVTRTGAKPAQWRNLRRGLTRPRAKPAKGRNPQKGETRQGTKLAQGRKPPKSEVRDIGETSYISITFRLPSGIWSFKIE